MVQNFLAMLGSLLLHFMLALLVYGLFPTVRLEVPAKMELELVAPPVKKNNISPLPAQSPFPSRLVPATKFKDELRLGAYPRQAKRLRLVREEIASAWSLSSPPGWGRAVIVLHINNQGLLVEYGIKHFTGSDDFQDFLTLFMTNLSFFHLGPGPKPLWLECEFRVLPGA